MTPAPWVMLVLGLGGQVIGHPLSMARVEPATLRVTEGKVRARLGGFASESAKVRAVAPGFRGAVEMRFEYLGPTAEEVRLASGEMRRQIGLKLSAESGCNVVYVMWRIAPVPGLVVSVKENPGQQLHDDCGAGGYRNVRPAWTRPVPLLAPGSRHVLRAELDGARLRVWVDGAPAWEGPVADGPLAFDGPVGLRADNARIDVELWGRPEPAEPVYHPAVRRR